MVQEHFGSPFIRGLHRATYSVQIDILYAAQSDSIPVILVTIEWGEFGGTFTYTVGYPKLKYGDSGFLELRMYNDKGKVIYELIMADQILSAIVGVITEIDMVNLTRSNIPAP